MTYYCPTDKCGYCHATSAEDVLLHIEKFHNLSEPKFDPDDLEHNKPGGYQPYTEEDSAEDNP